MKTAGLAIGFIAFIFIGLFGVLTLRSQLASQKVLTMEWQLKFQAADASLKSCQAAQARVDLANRGLVQATQSAYAATDAALQRASTRDQGVADDIAKLLKLRAPPGQDCPTALALGQAAWEEGQ